MNYRTRACLLAGVAVSLISSCAYLPQGHPARTAHAPVDAQSDDGSTASLFVRSGATGGAQTNDALNETPVRGLRIRKSKRGNMDSYVVRGQRYFTLDRSDGYSARGLASWYGPNFHGRVASNGEVYDMYRLTAAHKTLPLPTYARVTHLDNGKSVIVKINDRGPFSGDRLIDLSFAAALELGMVNDGTAMVEIKALSAEELLVMSGPDNKMGIEFYYDYSTPPPGGQQLAVESLFVDDRTVAEDAPTVLPSSDVAQAVAPSDTTARNNAANAVVTPVIDGSVAVSLPAAEVEGEAVDLASVEAEFIEVVVPGRQRPNETAGVAGATAPVSVALTNPSASTPAAVVPVSDTGMSDGVDIPLDGLAQEQTVAAGIATAPQNPAPLLESAALPVSAAGTLPALATANSEVAVEQPKQAASSTTAAAKERVLNLRYYLQAGVFADVRDAERVATNIVLEIPREEVHVKPLKDSAMYRVTVGPIVSEEHASEVSTKLDTAGIENYTVKVNES
jgi:rare lipoprotein A (peptidoglycan hydrolase)